MEAKRNTCNDLGQNSIDKTNVIMEEDEQDSTTQCNDALIYKNSEVQATNESSSLSDAETVILDSSTDEEDMEIDRETGIFKPLPPAHSPLKESPKKLFEKNKQPSLTGKVPVDNNCSTNQRSIFIPVINIQVLHRDRTFHRHYSSHSYKEGTLAYEMSKNSMQAYRPRGNRQRMWKSQGDLSTISKGNFRQETSLLSHPCFRSPGGLIKNHIAGSHMPRFMRRRIMSHMPYFLTKIQMVTEKNKRKSKRKENASTQRKWRGTASAGLRRPDNYEVSIDKMKNIFKNKRQRNGEKLGNSRYMAKRNGNKHNSCRENLDSKINRMRPLLLKRQARMIMLKKLLRKRKPSNVFMASLMNPKTRMLYVHKKKLSRKHSHSIAHIAS